MRCICRRLRHDGPGEAVRRPSQGRKSAVSRTGWTHGLLQQLRNLLKGLHPRTRVLLPPPISVDPHSDVPQAMIDSYSSQACRVYALGTPETLAELTDEAKRPPACTEAILLELFNFQPDAKVILEFNLLENVLRSSGRGSAPDLSWNSL